MRNEHTILLLGTLALASVALADEPAAGGKALRSAGDMTVAERAEMMATANQYDKCVYKEAMTRVDSDKDVRRIADSAMGACQQHLDALHAKILGWGFAEYFATGFTRTVQQHAAHQILPELAIRKRD